MSYKTRRRQLIAECKAATAGTQSIRDAVFGAAFIGGCAEREWCIKVIKGSALTPDTIRAIVDGITAMGIKDVWDLTVDSGRVTT